MTKTNNIKLHIHRLSFEMTRQCNLACAHCARGEAQNAVIKREYIDRVLDQIDYVHHLTLTGGEPSLHPDLIEYVVDGIIKRWIRVRFFDITINGTVRDMRIAAALDKIADWCGQWQVYADHLEVDGVPDKSDGVASLRISNDIFHRAFDLCKPEETLEFYQKACKSDRVIFSMNDLGSKKSKDDETFALRKTGRGANLTEEQLKQTGASLWSISCPYRRFDVTQEGVMAAQHYRPDGTKELDSPHTKWIDTGIDITTDGKFLKSSFCSYEETDALAKDSIMMYSLYECMRRWNARYPLYEEESKELYRVPMTYVANGMVDNVGVIAAKQMTFGLIEMRQQIQKTAPQLPFSVIADATYEPYKKAITGQPEDEVWKSKREAQRKLDSVLLATAFMPKPKEPHTYDEMMDYLEKY